MNIHKRQSVQKIVIDQAGRQRLILNDLILGFEGAQTVAELIPQYHPGLYHFQIKGNNIDSEGFQVLFAALANCPNLKSIQAQWNSIGTGPAGLQVLCHLVKTLPFLEFIDLKNNRISHQLVDYICQMIEINSKTLKVIDLRWNQLGQIGAQAIYRSLAYNSNLKYIGLDDNRISLQSLNQIEAMLKNVTRGTAQVLPRPMHQTQPAGWANTAEISQNTFPISEKAYPSMQLQVRNAQLRAKIQNEQNQTEIYQNKLKLQIDKTLQKLKAKGLQIHEYQLKYDSLNNQNLTLINQLRQAQRLLALEKQRYMGMDKGLSQQKSSLKTDKYNMSVKIQALMERTMQKNQRQVQELETVMSEKLTKLEGYYHERVAKKRSNRDKLVQLREDIMKLQMSKQSAWDRVTDTYQNSNKNSLEERCRGLEELVAKSQFQVKSQIKNGQHLSQRLSSIVLKGLEKEEKMQNDIFEIQNAIKDLHNQMGTTNVQIQENHSRSALLESKSIDKETGVEMRRKYIKYIQSQTSVNLQIERLKQEQDMKGEMLLGQSIQMRIADLQKAIRVEQAQNKMIRNQYDKLLGQVESVSKKTIQAVLFQV